MSFALFLLSAFIIACVAWALGYKTGHDDGADDGWDDGYQFATSDQEIRWQCTAYGAAKLEEKDREHLAELAVHEKFYQCRPSDSMPGVSFDPATRTFQQP